MILASSLALLAGFLWAFANIIDKTILSKYIKNPFVLLPIIGAVSLPIGLVIIILNSQILSSLVIGRIFLFTAVNFISIIFYFQALKNEEASRILPLFSLSAVFMVLIELLVFGTKLITLQYWGIATIVLGTIILSLKPGPAKVNKKALGFVIISAFTWGLTVVFLSDIFGQYGFWPSWGWQQISIGILGLTSFIFLKNKLIRTIKKIGHKFVYYFLTSQVLSIIAGAILFFSASIWVASLSSSLASDQYIFVFILSLLISKKWPHLLKEDVSKIIIIQKTISILLIIAGIFLISV